MNETHLLKLDSQNPDFKRAVERAKKSPPHVHCVSVERRIFTVKSQSRPGHSYVVRLTVAPNGLKLGRCNCRAGEQGKYCLHLVGAAALNVAIAAQRRQVDLRNERETMAEQTEARINKPTNYGRTLGGWQV